MLQFGVVFCYFSRLLQIEVTPTATADIGKEFAGHETIKEQLNADVYFAHPYHS
jgi:IS30 family transposase